MKIGIIGKYPPIQGGVSMRTFWAAHGLARLGHTVHVITNAREAEGPQRMFMRDEDWAYCEADYGGGSVHVHWTEPYGERQAHVPATTPYVTKLASIGIALAREGQIELVYSHYTEPYGVAGHMVAQATGLPHVTRTAGSDAGRLWLLPQFTDLYNVIFRSADAVITGQSVAVRMAEAGVSPARLRRDGQRVRLDEVFTPEGPALDVAELQHQAGGDPAFSARFHGAFDPSLSYFGVYGKIGKTKGTYALLDAIARMRRGGLPVGLLALSHDAHGDITFRRHLAANGLEDAVCQLPFLPHWRVPEFIRRCIAVCCLEQDFPIRFHNPIVAREILTCGACLIASTEVLQKMPLAHKLVDGFNCIAVRDVNDIAALEGRLISVFENPDRVAEMRNRARRYGMWLDRKNRFPRRLSSILKQAVRARMTGTGLEAEPAMQLPAGDVAEAEVDADAASPLKERFGRLGAVMTELPFADQMAVLSVLAGEDATLQKIADALKLDLLAEEMRARRRRRAGMENKTAPGLFRLTGAAFFESRNVDRMVPQTCTDFDFLELNPDVASAGRLFASVMHKRKRVRKQAAQGNSLWAVIPVEGSGKLRILGSLDASILRLCDGSRPVGQLCAEFRGFSHLGDGEARTKELRIRVMELFRAGFIGLWDPAGAPGELQDLRQTLP